MNENEALKTLRDLSRYSITPELAKEISQAFGLELDPELIYTGLKYRETTPDPSRPRVKVSTLAANICRRLGFKPDVAKYELSQQLMGVGSSAQEYTEAQVLGIERGAKK